MSDEERRYSLSELTEAAGVSPRTVRYYIGEGLLPPPVAAGPRSHYTDDHLVRLKAIGKMKDAYLPLREVRRRLNQLNDDQLTRLATGQLPDTSAISMPAEQRSVRAEPLESAAEYIARAMYQPAPASEELGEPAPPSPLLMGKYEFHAFVDPVENPVTAAEEGSSWRRIQLGAEAELLILEEAYQRNHDRVEWLINWAKKVFR
ncbi:MAG: MerR family transcriptional regulator [Thermomicrobiales bacterium]